MVELIIPSHPDCPEFRNATLAIGIRLENSLSNSPEYPHPSGAECTIVESVLGSSYAIEFDCRNPNAVSDPRGSFLPGLVYLEAELWIDGKRMDSRFLRQRGLTSLEGKWEGHIRRPFIFSAPKIVENGGIMNANELNVLGTIVIQIWPVRLVGTNPPKQQESSIKSFVHEVNEKAKKGVFISATTNSFNLENGSTSRRSSLCKLEPSTEGHMTLESNIPRKCEVEDSGEDIVFVGELMPKKREVLDVIDLTED
ncbi:hypothetical protein BCR33DRAFT_723430 [Rhizoclosmatium globosum]|uniref:DUF7918 domain-containing protein n=1 Tax=Rhizoclosmatium globosum TaxID=329046 RepID=A0A1Y2BC30_9FUNG|nr:hypothetical protein BCR33DRAFT_723430 [Rhizoclosmatium globosum]|eukprot:ORY32388.1 hypothetical protein BCR33DRAFT_723430 [Rhizoclosmatium globosum]